MIRDVNALGAAPKKGTVELMDQSDGDLWAMQVLTDSSAELLVNCPWAAQLLEEMLIRSTVMCRSIRRSWLRSERDVIQHRRLHLNHCRIEEGNGRQVSVRVASARLRGSPEFRDGDDIRPTQRFDMSCLGLPAY